MSYSIHKKNARGFSLIEILVYLAVTVTLAGALVTVFLSLNTTIARNTTERALMEGANVSLEQLSRVIRDADSINAGLSTFASTTGALALVESTTTTRFYLSGSTLMMSVNGADVGPLTSDEVSVGGVTFTRYTGSTTEMVRVGLTLTAIGKASSSTRTFYTSAVLRGTYE